MEIEKKDDGKSQKRQLILKVERFKELTPAELSDVHGANTLNCNVGCSTSGSNCIRDDD
jgi:hypothetical protein